MSNIKLRYKDPSDIFIKKGENISDVKLNEVFNKLLINDKTITPLQSLEPQIWECKWYNNPDISGYAKGTAVWYNTEDLDEFLLKRNKDIYTYGMENVKTSMKMMDYDPYDEESYNFYKNILSGYVEDDLSNKLQPLFDIGNLSNQVQIYILQKNNSKISPSEDLLKPESERVWKPFFKTTGDIINEILSTYVSQIIEDHKKQYHLGKYALDLESSFVPNRYLKKDFSNIDEEAVQTFQSHTIKQNLSGFDYVKEYVRDNTTAEISIEISTDTSTEISTITVDAPQKWFRLWNSGYLEHGGIITVPQSNNSIVSVFLDWEYNGNKAPVYDYTTNVADSFYGLYTKYDTNEDFNQDGCIDKENRYTIAITPVGDIENTIGTTEITMIRNDSFCLKLNNKKTKTRTFKYYTSGFRETKRS